MNVLWVETQYVLITNRNIPRIEFADRARGSTFDVFSANHPASLVFISCSGGGVLQLHLSEVPAAFQKTGLSLTHCLLNSSHVLFRLFCGLGSLG